VFASQFFTSKNEKYREELLQEEPLQGEMISIQPIRIPRSANVSYAVRERFVRYFNKDHNPESTNSWIPIFLIFIHKTSLARSYK